MPLREDEQSEHTPTSYSPQRRRRVVAAPRRPSTDYHSDEHPEVPKILRASRHLSEDERSAATTTAVTQQTVRPASTPKKTMRPDTTAGRVVHADRPARRPALPPPEPVYDDEDEQYPHSTTTHYPPTRKIMVERPRRNTVYMPPAPPPAAHYRARGRHRPRTLYSLLQDFSHNQTAIVVGTLLLLTLILFPILFNVIANNLRTQTTLLPGSTQGNQGTGQTSIGAIPADPREIVITPPNSDHPAPPVFATAAYLLDADTGATLYAHNPFLHLPMLSTTKLMTATLALEQQGNKLDQKVSISGTIANDIDQLSVDSSRMGIKRGESYTLRELMYGMLLVSGNDAALAVADTVGGNLKNFVAMMNQRASQLGLHDTHFMNPHGLLATGHYSSAHDLAILGRFSMNIPLLRQISSTKQYTVSQTADHPGHFLINGNQFLWWYPGVDGGKPGYDGGSNFIQVISVTRNGHHLIGVTMHTNDWWTDMRDLMNWGFNSFSWISPYDVDIAHPPIPFDYDWNYFVKDKKTNTISTVDQGRYYIYTGYSINGAVMNYFDKNGGLTTFGYPTSGLKVANETTSQSFEHGVVQCDTMTKQCKSI